MKTAELLITSRSRMQSKIHAQKSKLNNVSDYQRLMQEHAAHRVDP